MKKLLLYAVVLSAFTGCTTSHNLLNQTQQKIPFDIAVVKGSREVVLTQTLPWEEQMMGYFKVLKTGPETWQMWYSSWDNKRKDDYSDYLVYAYSKDGKNWTKEIPGQQNNILRGTGHPQKDGIVEQDVFIDSTSINSFKMIYTAKDETDHWKEKTFTEESPDGIHWKNRKVLWNQKHDSQFSVIQRDSLYYIYLRYWAINNDVRYRTIGLAIVDRNWNTIQRPQNILQGDYNSSFPHLYNPGATKINRNLDVLFPTFFNDKTNAIKFGVAYRNSDTAVLTDIDLTNDLLGGENNNWGIVSPGLIPAGKNIYWMYYYATNMVHSDYDKAGRKFKYYRIKIKIKVK